MGIFTYTMAISNFKQKLKPLLSNCTGYKQIISKDVNEYLAENRDYFWARYQELFLGFISLQTFEKKMRTNDSPFELHILRACCPHDIDAEDLRRQVLNVFLESLEEAIELNVKYRITRR